MSFNLNGYQSGNSEHWKGRIDSTSDFDQFRFHQIVKCIDITESSVQQKVVLLGFASDVGVERNGGRIGAALGPNHLRKNIGSLSWHGNEEGIIDAGNIIPQNNDLENATKELSKAVHHLLASKNKPIIIGGGHETALGHYLGIASFLKEWRPKAKLGILNIDAHFDLRPFNGKAHSGSSFLQAHEHAKQNDLDLAYFVYGINQDNNTKSLFQKANELNSKYCLNTEIQKNEDRCLSKLKTFIDERDVIYLTICLDVFDASICPGVSAPAWNGIRLEHALNVFDLLLGTSKLISADICELNPKYDTNEITAKTAGNLLSRFIR